jgi:hypothetical protein
MRNQTQWHLASGIWGLFKWNPFRDWSGWRSRGCPNGHWGRYTTEALANGSSLQRTPRAAAGITAPLLLQHLHVTQIYSPLRLCCEGWTHRSHMVTGLGCMGGWSNTFQHMEQSMSWTVQATWGWTLQAWSDTFPLWQYEGLGGSHNSTVHWWWCQGPWTSLLN